ncbi:ABC transporter permease [Bifidobacterium sp. 64T4]|uniref:YhgE/Pip domain-containing protein n=1 Tax=Bifidobacterium pongonis TaxID=2834432 RepID=UPI001C58CCCB|nr:ABC transporter permease [Bifidobacterium pongonis]MBW3095478.1 ABC transporter permease [Bifidobacterium pongonis]
MNKKKMQKILMPFVVLIGMFCAFALMAYPMLQGEPHDVPVAIVSQDEGVSTPKGDVNIGNNMVDAITDTDDSGDDTVAWKEFKHRSKLDDAFDNNEYYAAMIIPKDFSSKQVEAAKEAAKPITDAASQAAGKAAEQAAGKAATEAAGKASAQAMAHGGAQAALAAATQAASQAAGQAASEAASQAAKEAGQGASAQTLQSKADALSDDDDADTEGDIIVKINVGKNPLMANAIEQQITGVLDKAGMPYDLDEVNSPDLNGGSSVSTALVQITVMVLFLFSLIPTIISCITLRAQAGATLRERAKLLGVQLVMAVCASLLVACALVLIMACVGGLNVPSGSLFCFAWTVSLSLMLLFLGCFHVGIPLLGLVVLCCFSGMFTGMMPKEMLPAFWRDWIYPWAPQHYIGEGLRSVVYMGDGAWNSATLTLLWFALAGIVLLAVGFCARALRARRK